MSNQAVGGVYQTIIDEVINSSRVDFEENGVEESVLEELRQGWQQKLSQLSVARFPWDPKLDPQPPASQPQPPAPPQQQNHSQALFAPQLSAALAAGGPNGVKHEPGPYVKTEANAAIKQEPGSNNSLSAFNFPGDNKNSLAAHRASQQLQAQYGTQAARSINAIQDSMTQRHAPLTAAQIQAQGEELSQQQQQMYRQQMAAATAHQQARQQRGLPALPTAPLPARNMNNGSVGNGQTDGAGDEDPDYEGILMQRGASGDMQELGRVEIDRMLHSQIAAKAKSMEGGGLMLPLKEATKHNTIPAGSSSARDKRIAAYDGGDDDDVDDEDAINSDLDDPDDGGEDDEVDDEGLGHIMLCMYDKVQRVKNKWKCTLKDGVLTVNGKEYVFHKATGEYEW